MGRRGGLGQVVGIRVEVERIPLPRLLLFTLLAAGKRLVWLLACATFMHPSRRIWLRRAVQMGNGLNEEIGMMAQLGYES